MEVVPDGLPNRRLPAQNASVDMLDALKDIIEENLDWDSTTIAGRDLAAERVPGKATLFLGVRGSGKTTLLRRGVEELLAEGVPQEAICFIDFSDTRLNELSRTETPELVPAAYHSLHPEMEGKKAYFFFDEVRNLKGWETLVGHLFDSGDCEVNLSASGSEPSGEKLSCVMTTQHL